MCPWSLLRSPIDASPARRSFVRSALVGCALLSTLVPAGAQSNFVLRTFGVGRFAGGINGSNTNSDGINPSGWLTLAGATMYGTTLNGGTNGAGVLFSLATNGTFNLLYVFPKNDVGMGNSFGAGPNGGLVWSNGTLYGTTSSGGSADQGVIFSVGTNGTGIQNLHSFSDASSGTNPDGANPAAGMVQAGAMLFGTAPDGGNGGNGVVFAFNMGSKVFSVLHHFTAGNTNLFGTLTNSDGANPGGGLLVSGTTLYGTTSAGGTNGAGTVFAMSTNGAGFVTLCHFNANGANPGAGLILAGGRLFGMGGSIVFSLATNGAGFTVLHQFGGQVDTSLFASSGLTVSNGTLYGAASGCGGYGYGQVFAMNTNGTGFIGFHDFTPPIIYPLPATNQDGTFPNGGLILVNNALYGAASAGGGNGSGVLFKALPSPPVLSPQLSGRNLLLNLSTLAGLSYTVQQNTNVTGTNWVFFTNFIGSGTVTQFSLSTTNGPSRFFRVRLP